MKVTVKRKDWLRGRGPSFLRDDTGQMCCLGFVCLALGYTPEGLTGVRTPHRLEPNLQPVFDAKLVSAAQWATSTPTCVTMMTINDNRMLQEAEREHALKAEAATIDIELEFVG